MPSTILSASTVPQTGPRRSIDTLIEEVYAGLQARTDSLAGRIGSQLAAFICRPGKMLRARFCLLLGAALGVDEKKTVACGRISELTHNASLLHDDCVDEASMRRGNPTPNALFGMRVGLLLGDLAFSQAMDEALDLSPTATRGLVDTVQEMTIGEIQEEFIRGSTQLSVESYMGIAARKTAALFEWCGRAMSDMSTLEHNPENPPRLGRLAGILLQIVDDIHDFTLDGNVAGKQQGQDIIAQRLTLPIVFALQDPGSKEEFLKLWRSVNPGSEGARELGAFLESRGHMQAARMKALEILGEMLKLSRSLPAKPEAAALTEFMEVMARREF